jgi:type I restriction enzyme, S subunit
MEATTQKIDLNNIDKTDWETFRFEEIASKISETVDPNSTDLETYVGLEHLDAEDIHIRRKGTPDDVSGGKLKCYPGDVIFGKRRAYQRKAAIVDFEGICSAHAFVFRANPEVIDPNLFPFFLHSDQFMHRMVDISVGGLSPTINWGDLKHQEFLLPPKDQQAQLAELLWAMDEVIEREREVLERNEDLFISFSKSIFSNGIGRKVELKNLGVLTMGQSPAGNTYNENGSGMPFLQGKAEFGDKFPSFIKYTTAPNKVVPEKSILISVRAPVGDLNYADREYCIGRGLAGLFIEDKVLRDYVFNFLKYSRHELEKNSTGSTFKAINKDTLSSLNCIIPDENTLKNNSQKLNSILSSIESFSGKIKSSKALQKSLINQIF